jgi:hypothetical protein
MMKNNSRRWKKEEGAKVWEGMSHGMGGPWYGREGYNSECEYN